MRYAKLEDWHPNWALQCLKFMHGPLKAPAGRQVPAAPVRRVLYIVLYIYIYIY